MNESNEIEKIDREERTIFIILAIILVVAIGIIVTWYFTNNRYEDNKSDNSKPSNIIKEEKEDTKNNTETNKINQVSSTTNNQVKTEELVIVKPVISSPNLSQIVFKSNNTYEIPMASAIDSDGNNLVVSILVKYINDQGEILDLFIDEYNQIVIPADAKELIFTYTTVDKKGNIATEVIKVPVVVIHTISLNIDGQITSVEVIDGNKLMDSSGLEEFISNNIFDINSTPTTLTFGGWYTDTTLLNKYDFNNPVTTSLTLYAKWGYIVEYQEEINSIWTSVHKEIVIPNGTLSSMNTNKPGYLFGGWYVDNPFNPGTLIPYDNSSVTIDMILKGQWILEENQAIGQSAIIVENTSVVPSVINAIIETPDIINDGDKNVLNIILDTTTLWDQADVASLPIELLNDIAYLLYKVKAPDNAEYYRTSLFNSLSAVLGTTGDKYVNNKIDIGKLDQIEVTKYYNVPKTGAIVIVYYWYDANGKLISVTETEINVIQAP